MSEVVDCGNSIIFLCPYCELYIEVFKNEINCAIFRHAYMCNNGILTQQVNPHLPKEECEKLEGSNTVIGCVKPFRIVIHGEYKIVKCDYV